MQFKLPELGEGVHEGELIKWRVKPGENVKFDQPLCEIMTDKATVEIPSAFQGKVAQFHAKEGEIIHVGQLMITFEGLLTEPSAPLKASPAHQPPVSGPETQVPLENIQAAKKLNQQHQQHLDQSHSKESGRPLAAPSTRRLAREMGLELSQIQGSGPHGRIMKDDLHSKGQSSTSLPVKNLNSRSMDRLEERVPFRGLRKKISEKMRLSKDRAAHFTYVEEADASELVKLRSQSKEIGSKRGVKVTYLPFVMKAMVAALKQFPILNSSLDEQTNELVYKNYYNIALSIQTDDGLTAPVIKDVNHKSVLEIAKEIQLLVDKARAKKLTMEDFQDSTITLTNAGSIGGLFATPVINYPEVAILGFNKIFRKPVVQKVNGKEEIVIRDWTYFSISLDHRIVDGAVGAEFMKLFIQYIENPSLLILDSF